MKVTFHISTDLIMNDTLALLMYSVTQGVTAIVTQFERAAKYAGLTLGVLPGTIAWSVAMLLGNQEAPRSILASGTSFREDLVMKIFYGHSSSSADSRRGFVSLWRKDVHLVLVTSFGEACPGAVWIG